MFIDKGRDQNGNPVINNTMLTDYYELTMANGYYKLGLKDQWVCFDVFFRKVPESGGYVIAAGLESIISFEKRRFSLVVVERSSRIMLSSGMPFSRR